MVFQGLTWDNSGEVNDVYQQIGVLDSILFGLKVIDRQLLEQE